jgi:hypothetical protein
MEERERAKREDSDNKTLFEKLEIEIKKKKQKQKETAQANPNHANFLPLPLPAHPPSLGGATNSLEWRLEPLPDG